MKQILVTFCMLLIASGAFADDKAGLDNRIRKLTGKFQSLQAKPDKAIPAETLKQARGIVLLDRTKAGFIFAFQGGGGLAMVRDVKSGKWSAPAFLSAAEASLGFQVGGQQSFVVILLMNTNSTRFLTDGDIEFGGEARGTAGNSTAGAEGNINPAPSVLVYDDRKGLYGGAALKGGAVSSDEDANTAYYEQYVTLEDILFKNKFKPGEAAQQLIDAIEKPGK